MLANNSLPAERARRVTLAENFSSNEEIIRNEGSIAGTVVSYPTKSGIKTVVARLKQPDVVSNTVKIDAANTITITAGSVFGSFTDPGGILADDIEVDDYTKFEYVKFFTEELTAEEILGYQNNDWLQYMNQCITNLPFTSLTHDPDNNQTLDLRKLSNLTFGNGSTSTTFPKKLKERGYSTDGGDSLRFAGNPFSTSDNNVTFAALLRPSALNAGQVVVSIENGLVAGALILLGLNKISFFSGTSILNHEAKLENLPLATNQLYFVVGINDSISGFTRIYVNGAQGVDAPVPVNPGFTNEMTMQTFVRGNFATQPAVNNTGILQLILWNKALTPLQIQDLTINSLASYNKT